MSDDYEQTKKSSTYDPASPPGVREGFAVPSRRFLSEAMPHNRSGAEPPESAADSARNVGPERQSLSAHRRGTAAIIALL